MRVLLTDGSGLTARQVATQLSLAGHVVEVLSPDPFSLTRFTRHVRRLHRVEPFGSAPFAWMDTALGVYRTGGFDALFPTQEQVAVLSRVSGELRSSGVATAVPTFDALRKVQDKISASATLSELGLPQPHSTVVSDAGALAAWDDLPAYVKIPIGTATTGVRHVKEPGDLEAVAATLEGDGAFSESGVLVQEPATGPLVMVQAVFREGALVASHANKRAREGVSGGASHKVSVDLPVIREHLEMLGGRLAWHGALSADVILTEQGPSYIDINPRLVEPGNAWRSGVDLVSALLNVACAKGAEPSGAQPPGRPGVATHQLILAVLGAAQHVGTRRAVLAELLSAGRRQGSYENSVEELTPLRHDLRTAVPVIAASSIAMARPASWKAFSSGAVANYALTPAAWREILAGAPNR
jgi:hypothetical protein